MLLNINLNATVSVVLKDDQKTHELLRRIIVQGANTMATIDDLAKDVGDEKTLIDGVSTLVTGLKDQLTKALSGLPQETQDKVDAVFAQLEANKAKLTDALGANLTTAVPANVPVA